MKKIILSLCMMAFAVAVFGQNPHNILRKYKNNDGVMSVKFEGDILDMLEGTEEEPIKSTLKYVDIVFFKEGQDLSEADQQALKTELKNSDYEMLINVKDDGKQIKVMGVDGGETIKKAYVSVKAKEFNVYVVVEGNIYFDELSKINLDKVDGLFD